MLAWNRRHSKTMDQKRKTKSGNLYGTGVLYNIFCGIL